MKRLEQEELRGGSVARIQSQPMRNLAQLEPRPALSLASDKTREAPGDEIEELQESLAKATRRINRLQGERSQLEALLEKRDRQIEALCRELGAHKGPEQAAQPVVGKAIWTNRPFGTIFTSLARQISERVRHSLHWSSSAGSWSFSSRRGESTSTSEDHERLPVVIILLIGLDEGAIAQLLPSIEKECASRNMRPICLVDNDSFELLRARSIVFEYLPPADDRLSFDPSLHWDLYMQRRLAVMRRKWQPARTIAFGKVAMDVLDLWTSSPFEDKPLPVASNHTRQDGTNWSNLTVAETVGG